MKPSLVLLILLSLAQVCRAENWYTDSFWLLHEDHHTSDAHEVGRDADFETTRHLVGQVRPDMIQMHAKGNPGWTTYPTKIGHTPSKLKNDVLSIWRETARRDGYHFSAYYNIGRDGEIMKRRPEWNRMYEDGAPVDRALCYHSGVADQYLWPMIREIMAAYQPQGFWFDGSCFTVRPCYCAKCKARFRSKHNLDIPATASDPAWNAYQEMQREIYREFIAKTCREIHKLDSDCLVSVNWAYSLRMPEKPDSGIAYLTGDIGNRVEGLSAEAHWYDSTGLPFDLMTQVSTLQPVDDVSSSKLAMQPKPACQLEQEMAIIIANGGRFHAWDNPTPESGLVPERFEFMSRVITPFLRSRQPYCQHATRLPDVSLLHTAAIHYATTEKSATSFSKRNNRIDGAACRLASLHLNYEMLPNWRLYEGDVKSQLVIVEHPKGMTRKTADSLLDYVRNGGSLLLTGMGLTQDRRFPEVFGVRLLAAPKQSERLSTQIDNETVEFNHWLYRLDTQGAKTLMHVETDNGASYPLLTHHQLGKGSMYYVPLPLLSDHGDQAVPRDVLSIVFESVVPSSQRLLVTDAPETVEVVLRRQGERQIVHLVNMATGEREVYRSSQRTYPLVRSLPPVPRCSVKFAQSHRPASVMLQPQNEPVEAWEYEDGQVSCEVPSFAVHQIVVVR